MIVLSACHTGLGGVAGGEEITDLQRAFHLAGARNVVATLWRSDERANTSLMRLFYHYRLAESLPAIEALRRAQLAMRNNPQQVIELATLSAADFRQAVSKLDDNPTSKHSQISPYLWAGVVLSGRGR
jgi:CHAT domain-containing protein